MKFCRYKAFFLQFWEKFHCKNEKTIYWISLKLGIIIMIIIRWKGPPFLSDFHYFWGGLIQQQWIQFLAMKHHQKSDFIDDIGNSIVDRRSPQDEYCEGRQKSVIFPKTIDVAHELILKDRHVRLRQTWGISGNCIHSIFRKHLNVKQNCSRWIPHNLSIAQKRFVSICRR